MNREARWRSEEGSLWYSVALCVPNTHTHTRTHTQPLWHTPVQLCNCLCAAVPLAADAHLVCFNYVPSDTALKKEPRDGWLQGTKKQDPPTSPHSPKKNSLSGLQKTLYLPHFTSQVEPLYLCCIVELNWGGGDESADSCMFEGDVQSVCYVPAQDEGKNKLKKTQALPTDMKSLRKLIRPGRSTLLTYIQPIRSVFTPEFH